MYWILFTSKLTFSFDSNMRLDEFPFQKMCELVFHANSEVP